MAQQPDDRDLNRKPEDEAHPGNPGQSPGAGIPHLSFEDVPPSSSYLTGLQVPNMSLDDPQLSASYLSPPGILDVMENEPALKKASSVSAVVAEAEIVEESLHVLSAEPVSLGSSVIELAELVASDDDSSAHEVSAHVLSDDFEEADEGSSVISASVFESDSTVEAAEVVESTSDIVEAFPASDVVLNAEEVVADEASAVSAISEVKAAPATPPPSLHEDAVEADFLAIEADEDEDLEGSSVFANELLEDDEPALAENMTEDEVLADLLNDADSPKAAAPEGSTDKPKKAQIVDLGEDTIDLGSEVLAEKAEDSGHTVAFVDEADSGTVVEALDDEDSIADASLFEDEEKPAPKKKKTAFEDETELDMAAIRDADLAEEVEIEDGQESLSADDEAADVFMDEEETGPKVHASAAEDDSAARALLDDDEIPVAAAKAIDEEGADEFAADVSAEEEETPVLQKKKGQSAVAEEEELVGVGAGSGKPRFGGWLGGLLLAILLFGGGTAAIWFLKPDLLEQVSKSSPNFQAPAVKADPALRAAQANLEKTKSELLALQTKGDTKLKDNEKKLLELKNLADKATAAKLAAEKNIEGVQKDLEESKTGLTAVNKLLEDAKITEPGEKGVAKLVTAKKEVEDKLDAVNKLLADEKIKGEGAQGLEEMIASRAKLVKDRDELDQAIKGVYQDLVDAGLATAQDDPRTKIAEAVKIARTRAETPLVTPLAQLGGALGGLGTSAGQAVELSFDMAALSAGKLMQRLQEPLAREPLNKDLTNKELPNKELTRQPEARPAYQEPEVGSGNPALAEQFFGKGLHMFWARNYYEAETQFRKALQFYNQDARYQYFLGITLLAQGNNSKRAAGLKALEQGARLEAANRPGISEVNASLERLQGPLRSYVDGIRQKALPTTN